MVYSIKIVNILDNNEHIFEVKNLSDSKSIYYIFNLDLSEIDNGEYKLYLIDKQENIIVTDILRIGNYNNNCINYNNETKYIQYGN